MSGDERELRPATLAVHAGESRGATPAGAPTSTPVYATTTFTYPSMREMDEVFSGAREGHVYTRHGNPTVGALEEAVRALEGGRRAVAFASGMAALHGALLACELRPGARVLASQDLYGATATLLEEVFAPFGVETETCDFADAERLRARVAELRPRALVAETISNPLLRVCDLEQVASVAREAGARLVVDNTFATPLLCRPLSLGADLVVHSATKFLGGHGDATGGVVVAREESDGARLYRAMKLAGGVLGVWEAHEILRGIKTLAVRLERQCENARLLAERLAGHAKVARVYYPTLETGGQQRLAARVLGGRAGGALVTVELKEATREAAFRFMDALRLCVRSTSLGDVFTGVLHPVTASHRDLAPERRRALGITDGVVRVSVGLEDIRDIAADVLRALEA
ncbi:MAG TPA: PLP-dependent aspartate aminotransferase family protein [Pyrinomonadaceae bacterium]|nr:PLP-dependent aspartate aminotransferase family protein [Pyrinomonadaceae bacterium]